MLGQIQTRIKRLERRLAEAEGPTKEPMPSWMFEEVQEPDVPVDSSGGSDLSSWPGDPAKE